MRDSLRYLMGLAGVAGLSFTVSLPSLAQTATPDQTTAPSGVVDRPTAGESGRSGAPGTGMPGMSQSNPGMGSPSASPDQTTAPTGNIDRPTAGESGGPGMPGMGMPGMSHSNPGMGMDSSLSLPSATDSLTLGEIVGETRSFSLLNALLRVAAIEEPGLLSRLAGDGKYTVFAPTDRAFAALPPGAVHALVQPQNRKLLVELLAYHIVPGEVSAANMGTTNIGRELMSNLPPSGELRPNENSATDRSQVIEPNRTGSNNGSGSGVMHSDRMGNSSMGNSSMSGSTGMSMGQNGQAQAGLPPSGELRPNENSARTDRSGVVEPNATGANNGSGSGMGMSSPGGMSTSSGMGNSGMGNGSMGSMQATSGMSSMGMIASDIQASNGIIHAIGRVIVPSALQAQIQEAIAADTAAPAPRR